MLPFLPSEYFVQTKNGRALSMNGGPLVFALINKFQDINSRVALHCWFELMVPTLASSTDNEFMNQIISSLEAIFAKGKLKGGDDYYKGINTTVNFINLYHSQKLSKASRQRIGALFDQIMEANIFQTTFVAKYFVPLLSLAASGNEAKQTEVFALLSKSLVADPGCTKKWKEAYTDYVPQTNNLLRHIAENWKKGTGGVVAATSVRKRNTLHQELVSFLQFVDKKNENYEELKLDKEVVEVCTATCHYLASVIGDAPDDLEAEPKSVQEKSSEGINMKSVVLTILMLLLVAFIYFQDIQFSDIRHFVKEGRLKLGL